MSPSKTVTIVAIGQSNLQGAARLWNGGPSTNRDRAVSRATGETDPFPGCNNSNQGGSMFPYLIDYGIERGIRYKILNYAIGGASVFQHTGRLGGTVTGDPATPANVGFFSGGEYSGGTTILTEGQVGFDPFGLLSRARTAIAGVLRDADAVVAIWSNGESDAGSNAVSYQTGLESVGRYMFNSGADAFFIGLTSKNFTASTANFQALEQGRADAVLSLREQGFETYDGANLWAYYGEIPPLYPETTGPYVHLTLRGQQQHARLWNAALAAAGY